jgi:hypothetical protein
MQFTFRRLCLFMLSFSFCLSVADAKVYVSEIMADNGGSLLDVDGDASDWIELYNDSSSAVSLAGWYLTDNAANLTKWTFPATSIPAKGFLVVFASDKKRAVAGQELHTNFKLSASGEYVALVRPDGVTIENGYSFPAQLEDVSWGYAFSGNATTTTTTLVNSGAACTAHVPTHSTDAAGWRLSGFNDSSWLSGTTGVGYDRDLAVDYNPYIGLNVESAMYNLYQSIYIRVPFTYDGSPVTGLRLRMMYDDGFVAYLNGTQIASAYAPSPLLWNSPAAGQRKPDSQSLIFQNFDVSAYSSALQTGANVLAIQGLNISLGSSDFLILPVLESLNVSTSEIVIEPTGTGMLNGATPGLPNGAISYLGLCDTPVVFPGRGFYDSAFQVSISNVTAGAVVRYTLDGSTPTESSPLYTGPFTVSGTTLLRASAFKENYQPSAPNTQTYLYVRDVLKQDGSGLQSYADWGHSGPDWGVDPTMTNSVITDFDGNTFTLSQALLDVPTVSLTMDWDYWWSDAPGPVLGDGTIPYLGIYADRVAESAVKRPVSMELFAADGSEDFAANGAVSIVGAGIGGTSANRWKTDKLSMRILFDEKLDYPFFGEEAAQRFKGVVFDAHINNTWVHSLWRGQRDNPKFLTDAVASDLQNGMSGKGAPHSRFIHLYLNGLYWGLYDMHERPDDHFAAEYFGGPNEDYDAIKHIANDTNSNDQDHDGDPYNDNIVNGDDLDFQNMLAVSRTDLSQQANYEALAAALDLEDFIDYLLANFFLGNTDWSHKNWYATHNRVDPTGKWRFHSWDVEHVMGNVSEDVTTKDNYGSPTEIHQNLTTNMEYRVLFSDHIHRHFFNDGILTVARSREVFWNRVLEIDRGMLGEAARWADNTPNEGHDWQEWGDHMTYLRDSYFSVRSGNVFNQLRSRGLYPNTAAPEFEVNGVRQHGGLVAPSNTVSIASGYPVYYTTDGTDPRAVGGAAVGTLYAGPLSLTRPTKLKARAKNGSEWSALCEAVFLTEAVPLAFTELMYHGSSNELDFIEVRNISAEPVSLYGYKIDSAIDFKFALGTVLDPGGYLVVIKDIDNFSEVYNTNGIAIAGEYKGNFNNSGEKVQLEFWNHDLISFRYSDARNWPQAADGAGHSLVPLESAMYNQESGSLKYGGNWRASTYIGGSPGYADPLPQPTVMINEITAHTDTDLDPPFDSNDKIELYNPTASPIILNGWYLSDSLGTPHKWAIPDGTVVPALGFVLFDEDDFHPDRVTGFGLNKAGEQVVLSSPNGVVDAIRFKGQENGVSFGRYPDGSNHWLTTILTPGTANQPVPESIRIAELMYNPPAPVGHLNGDAVEYIQLENRSGNSVLFENTAGSWRIDGGVSYTFPTGFTLPAGDRLWLVSFDPADTALLNLFCTTYGLNAAQEIILGPYKGRLSNEGERVAVERPQDSDDPLNPYDVSWVVVDELFYFDRSPWPVEADGTGYPLRRTALTRWGVPTPTDTDADGLDDDWEISYFGSLAQQGDADPDLDGFSNLEEQIAGTDPTDAQSIFIIDEVRGSTIEWSAVAGRTYSVYWTGDLTQPFLRIASGLTQGSYSDPFHSTNSRNYYYITVEQE